jgi:hypothetical protein
MDQYIVPGEDLHDELTAEGQYVVPGQSLLDQRDDNVASPAATPRVVVFVNT